LLPETNEAAALVIAERLLAHVRRSFYPIGEENIDLTVSIGLATATASMSGIETLIKRADDALYVAKRSGRDQVAVASGNIGDDHVAAAEEGGEIALIPRAAP
jgi:diguanylate cyclase (GGDEF)-like protein